MRAGSVTVSFRTWTTKYPTHAYYNDLVRRTGRLKPTLRVLDAFSLDSRATAWKNRIPVFRFAPQCLLHDRRSSLRVRSARVPAPRRIRPPVADDAARPGDAVRRGPSGNERTPLVRRCARLPRPHALAVSPERRRHRPSR